MWVSLTIAQALVWYCLAPNVNIAPQLKFCGWWCWVSRTRNSHSVIAVAFSLLFTVKLLVDWSQLWEIFSWTSESKYLSKIITCLPLTLINVSNKSHFLFISKESLLELRLRWYGNHSLWNKTFRTYVIKIVSLPSTYMYVTIVYRYLLTYYTSKLYA